MKVSKFKGASYLLGLMVLAGCSGENQTSEQQADVAEALKINEQKMYGAWQSSDKQYGYEFHASPTQLAVINLDGALPEAVYQPEGVIYENGQPSKYFIWTLLGNGTLRLELKQPACQARPVALCTTDSIQSIEVNGSNANNLAFKISQDDDLDGKFDVNHTWNLSKKVLPAMNIGEKAYLVEPQSRADGQYLATENTGKLSITRPGLERDFVFSETSRDNYNIDLESLEPITTTSTFYVYNYGDRDIQINHNYEYFKLYPGFDDSVIVSFKVNRELQLDEGMSVDDVDLNGAVLHSKRSRRFTISSAGNYAPNIEYGKSYYSIFWNAFDIEGLDNGSGNEIIFIDDSHAKIITGNVLSDQPLFEQVFTYRKGSHSGEFIFDNERATVYVEFLSGQDERYRVIISTYDKVENEWPVRFAHDYFFAQNEAIDVSELLPREFEFIHIEGIIKSPVRLLADGEVELVNVEDVEGGRWFFNGTNELVRFECTNVAQVEILDYDECLDSFNYVATTETKTDYSHISKLKFLNKVGNTYLVQYDAAFWGGRWGREDHIRRFSVYYEWIHLAR